jgi:hypothetical protein
MRNILRDEGHRIWRKRVRRLMRKMGLMAMYQKPKISLPRKSGIAHETVRPSFAIDWSKK